MFISWPTKRLLMAEVSNERDDETGDSRDGHSSPGGETPATLESALDGVQQGYEPYAGFPAAFVTEELKLLISANGPMFPAADLLTDRDWKGHAKCSTSGPGEPPLVVQVDYDLAHFITTLADHNGIDTERYANNLLEKAVLEEGGVGAMILNRSQIIGGVHVDAGAAVEASEYHGGIGEESRFSKRNITAKVEGKTVEGVVDLGDLLRHDHAAQDRELTLQRVKQTLAGLNVTVHPLAGEGEAGSHIVRVACNVGDTATLAEVNRRLKAAGLVAHTQGRTILHVRS